MNIGTSFVGRNSTVGVVAINSEVVVKWMWCSRAEANTVFEAKCIGVLMAMNLCKFRVLDISLLMEMIRQL